MPRQIESKSTRRIVRGAFALFAACGMFGLASCTSAPKKPTMKYVSIANRKVPSYLEGTIYEYTDLIGTEPSLVSGYGLVTHLHGTGGSHVPTPVRAYMLKMLMQHHVGGMGDGMGSPEDVLNSKDVAVVRVDGVIPPGARSELDHGADRTASVWEMSHNPSEANAVFEASPHAASDDWCTWFDVRVSVPPGSDATSLAHGVLYMTDLKVDGANASDPNEAVLVKAQAAGEVFVNPQYVLDSTTETPAAQRSRRTGIVLAGGRPLQDQPLTLRLRAPERQMARVIEQRIIDRFQNDLDEDLRSDAGSDTASAKKVANAEDEAIINMYVPRMYNNNWEHFAGLVQYLYLDGGNPVFAAHQAKVLTDEAENDPNAPLREISYCLEGLGKPALYAIEPMMSSPKFDVRFAAARAAAFLDDPAAVPVLLAIAQTPGDPFRINAVQTLADLPGTPRVDRLCRLLLDSDEAMVRVEAYKALARHGDSSVYTRWITNAKRERFALDIVHTDSPPMVYASRQGVPRVAVFGNDTSLELPLMFSALDGRLTISTDDSGEIVTLFYRGSELPQPVTVQTTAGLPQLVAALAGDGTTGGASTLHLDYADVVAVLQSLIDDKKVAGLSGQHRLLASFMLQEPTEVDEPIDARPLLRTGSRPNSDRSKPAVAPKGEHPLLRATPAPATERAVNAE
jgi:flagellar basal body P-ring protein FlgI